MRRRSYLAVLGGSMAGFAGCSSALDWESDDTPTPTSTSPGSLIEDRVGVVELETASRVYALRPTRYHVDGFLVELSFLDTATADSPAIVLAGLRNKTDYERPFPIDRVPPFQSPTVARPRDPWDHGERHERSDRDRLVFAPTEHHDLAELSPDVSRDDDGRWRAEWVGQWFPDEVTLGPGEWVQGEYHLVGHPDDADDGLTGDDGREEADRPTGIYEFEMPGPRALRLTAWDPARPGPGMESRFDGDPPSPREEATAWYHDADETTPTYLVPGVERTTLPAETTFTFVNHIRESLGCGHWGFYKLVDGEWFYVGSWDQNAICRKVLPGGTKRSTLRTFHHEGLDCSGCGPGWGVTYDHLGGGRYAVVVGFGHATEHSGALIEFDAPAVEVAPTDDVERDRDDAMVTVTADRYGDDADDTATFEARRIGSADDRLIAEQVMQRRPLRNTLPFFENGIERVILRTGDGVGWQLRDVGDEVSFRFRGEAYEVRRTGGE